MSGRAGVVLAVLATFLCIAARSFPHVVSGIGVFTVIQALALAAILVLLWRGRAAIGAWVRTAPTGRHGALLAGIGILVLFLLLVTAVSGELREGRVYDRVAAHFDRKTPEDAAALALSLRTIESAPLRTRVLEEIESAGVGSPVVIDGVRNAVRSDEDRGVRNRAVEAFGKLMTDRALIDAVAELPNLDPATRELFAQALRIRTGEKTGPDPAAWRSRVAEHLLPEPGRRGWAASLDALRALGDDARVRAAAIARIATGDGSEPDELRHLLGRDDPALRAAVARALGRTGRPRDVYPLAEALKREADPSAAAAEAAAALTLDPARARELLTDAAKRAATEAGRSAAAAALR